MKKTIALCLITLAGCLQAQPPAAQEGFLQPELVPPIRHTGVINDACFSPDGRYVVTGGSDGTTMLWDVRTGKLVRDMKGRAAVIQMVCFSPDGWRFVAACRDSTAKVWDIASGKQVLTLAGHTNFLMLSGQYSPDGKYIVTGSYDGTAKLWDAATGKQMLTLKGHFGEVANAGFSPDGRHIVTASSDSTVMVWNAKNGKAELIIRGHSGAHANSPPVVWCRQSAGRVAFHRSCFASCDKRQYPASL